MTHEERVYHHSYETCEGIAEHAERIAKLEELVIKLWHLLYFGLFKAREVEWTELKDAADQMKALGLEVDQ